MLSFRRPTDDEGFSLLLVIGMSAIILGLVAVITTTAGRTLRSSTDHSSFEGALAVAETGVDTTLDTISQQYNTYGTSFTTGGACALTAPGTTFATSDAERTWATGALAGLPSSCLVTTASGQFVAVRPSNRQAVYAMGWSPSRTAAHAKRRMIKAEYLFSPYKPSNAILTGGNVDFSGSVAITTSGDPADVHSNSNVTGINGSTNVDGTVTASGSVGSCGSKVTGGCLASQAYQSIPNVTALSIYKAQVGNYSSWSGTSYTGSWYDLCPDGTVHYAATSSVPTSLQPAGFSALAPCTGPVAAFNQGWQWTAGSGTTAPLWTLPRTAGGPYPGVYYVHYGDAKIGDSGNSKDTWQMTVLAESNSSGGTAAHCSKLGGNISWKLFNMTPKMTGTQLVADADITGDANASSGSGLFYAGDKFDLSTSSAAMTGSVIAKNRCAAAGGNNIQGVSLAFDDTVESPLTDLIRTSLWLEYPAGS